MKFVGCDTLAAYLAVTGRTLQQWSQNDLIVRDVRRGYRARFTETAVDAFLALHAHGYVQPPTLADLQSGRTQFITAEQAARLYGLYYHRWLVLAHEGEVRSFNIKVLPGSMVRLDHASVRAYAARLASSLTSKRVLHIVGNKPDSLKRAVGQGQLELANKSLRIDSAHFTTDSLLRCLQQWIVTDITPQDWLEQRQSSQEELLGTDSAAALLGLCREELFALLDKGTVLHALKAYGGNTLKIDPDSVRAYQERCKPLTIHEMARIFGVTHRSVQGWIHGAQSLVCPVHKHSTRRHFYRWCLCAYLADRCSPAITPARWISQMLRPTAEPLIAETQAARRFGIPPRELQARRQAGQLKAILLPSGKWQYRVSQLRNLKYRK